MQLFYVTRDRFKIVHEDIANGSEPALRFYLMVAVSTLIASFGLISDSTAVVIGAMLVAPLMTPIFGIALALVRGETGLLGRALRAEIMGVLAALAMSFVLGSLIGHYEPTGEMLARTRPNLFDLLVAVLAGFAGTYALIDEKISPALPGVAIATAIVPPLANSGLCLALGEVEGGIGSFLLFFANFLSILLVASATFILSGMAKHYGAKIEGKSFVRRLGLPVIAFVATAAFMSHSLYVIYEERRIDRTIYQTMIGALADIPSTYLGSVYHDKEGDKIQVLAGVHTPKFFTPSQVLRVQEKLSASLEMPVELLVHCVVSSNVSAHGSINSVMSRNLDGSFVRASNNPALAEIAISEQVLREYFADDMATNLFWVDLVNLTNRKIMVAQVVSMRDILPSEITLLQDRIRQKAKKDNLYLVISRVGKQLQTEIGPMRYGWIPGNKATPAIRQKIDEIREELTKAFAERHGFDLVEFNATSLDDKLYLLLEIRGPKLFPQSDIDELQTSLTRKYSMPVVVYAWSRVEVVRGPHGEESVNKMRRYFIMRQKENLPKELPALLGSGGR
ncbi:TIGR00341 family protein [Desulfoferula mesophila]